MEVQRFSEAAEFRRRADSLLLAREARHNLILGVTGTLIDRPEVYPEFYLWVVTEDGAPVAAASMTPPYNLIVADASSLTAVEALAEAIAGEALAIPGVVGNQPTVGHFVEAWERSTGSVARLAMAQGVFALSELLPVPEVSGRSRPAGEGDRRLLIDWTAAFSREALPEDDGGPIARAVELRLAADPALAGFWLWEDGDTQVSLSGYGGRTPNGVRIGPVYTPPEHRGRGYATALVAAQSRWLLSEGRRFCFLYTDLSNPTSNAIYQRIGYEQVAESAEYRF